MNVRKAAAALAAAAVLSVPLLAAEFSSGKNEPVMQKGYRAVTLTFSGAQIAFVKKGDRVDVLVTFDAQMSDKAKEKVTATILQNVVVTNVSKPAKLEDRGAVEIMVNPNEAQYAALGQMQGELSLSIRAEGDTEMHPMEMASFRKLFR